MVTAKSFSWLAPKSKSRPALFERIYKQNINQNYINQSPLTTIATTKHKPQITSHSMTVESTAVLFHIKNQNKVYLSNVDGFEGAKNIDEFL